MAFSMNPDEGDPFFGAAWIDVDEWRDDPVRHRYVHGGFESTNTRFSFYFPPAEGYEGRFLQTLQGGLGGSEHTASSPLAMGGTIAFAFECGGYLVESNQGHIGADMAAGAGADPSARDDSAVGVVTWRASAQAARYAKRLAAEMYGEPPAYGYVWGGSGGGRRSLFCVENAPDLWQGTVPYILGSHDAAWTFWSIIAEACLILEPKMQEIVDATEVGGAGDPFVPGLSTAQRDALSVLYRAGFPRGAERQLLRPMEVLCPVTWAWHEPTVVAADPDYFEIFWTTPGYLGHDAPEQLAAYRTNLKSRVVRLLDAKAAGRSLQMEAEESATVALEVEGANARRLIGARITVLTGAAEGLKRICTGGTGEVLTTSALSNEPFAGVEVGDEVLVDNRDFLAFAHWHRHQVGEGRLRYRELQQFALDGVPIYPQRPVYGARPEDGERTGRFEAKMIVVQNAIDGIAWPNGALSYLDLARAHLGDDFDGRVRLWWTSHARHGGATMMFTSDPDVVPVQATRLVDFHELVQQAVKDVIAWVEDEVDPPRTSGFNYTADHSLDLAPVAAERHGIQPVVKLLANGSARADIERGGAVSLDAEIDVPPGTGTIIAVRWDFEGTGEYPLDTSVDGSASSLRLHAEHAYAVSGTYYPAVLVTSHREGKTDATTRRVHALGRARVVVA
jgi:Tannase and feruloyl esterase